MKWLRNLLRSSADRHEETQREAVNTLYVNSAGQPVRHERSLTVTTTSRRKGMTRDVEQGLEKIYRGIYEGVPFKATERYSPGWLDPRQ